jgi:hypothetical protein
MDYSKAIMSAKQNDIDNENEQKRKEKEHLEDLLKRIKKLTPRIKRLIDTANQLLDAGYWSFLDPGDWGKCGFVSEGWAHHFGLMLDRNAPRRTHIDSVGIVAGGYCGEHDFHTTGEATYMTGWYKSTPDGTSIKVSYAERTLEDFDDFEQRFYTALEDFLAKKGVSV